MLGIYYMIRHKATQEFMPQLKKRGYTHWNPAITPTNEVFRKDVLTGVPRLLASRGQAHRVIVQWAALPNAHNTFDHDGEADLDIKDDGRKKEDLEIVKVNIEEVKND